jgi:putative MATE family efflux protein
MARRNNTISKDEMFANAPVLEALAVMAVPTIISQLINLIYNMVDAFFIGRTGNSYMMAATTITLTMVMLNVAFSNLFGVGGGSLVARLMGRREPGYARQVSAFSVYGAITLAVTYSVLVGVFLDPVLRLLGASDATIGFARQYALIVIVLGSLPSILSLTLAHLLRNAGYSGQASLGLSMGGVLNIALDPLFMFVLLPRGQEVVGAAIATTLSNVIACLYLLIAVKKATAEAPLSMRLRDAIGLEKHFVRDIFSVGVPSAMLTGMFDLANICLNVISAAHSDLVLAAMGIVMKVERLPNAINVGLSQGMMPIVAYNYASGNEERMNEVIRKTRYIGLAFAGASIVLFEIFAGPVSRAFLSTSGSDAEIAMQTVAFAATFLRLRCLASPVQFINYNTSFCMQGMGKGKETLLHATVRQLGFYIPIMFLMDRLWGTTGLASALVISEALSAVFALWLLRRSK